MVYQSQWNPLERTLLLCIPQVKQITSNLLGSLNLLWYQQQYLLMSHQHSFTTGAGTWTALYARNSLHVMKVVSDLTLLSPNTLPANF